MGMRYSPPEGIPQIRRARQSALEAKRPPCVTAATWTRLARHVEWALTKHPGWRNHLRETMKVVAAELQLGGVANVEIAQVLRASVLEHPACATSDRVSLLTREPRSSQLVRLMLRWFGGLDARGF